MSYNANIPQPGDLISQSQPQILTNFSQANTAFSVDHTAFDVALNQGKHKKSTYVEQTVDPGTSANEISVYSKDVAGVTTEFLRKESNGTVIATSGQDPVRSGNGSSYMPGDATRSVIIKWGSVAVPASPQAFVFTSAFPNACFQVIVSGDRPDATATRTLYVQTGSITTAGFNAVFNGTYDVIRYIAIGN
jgi:hypothetical protein